MKNYALFMNLSTEKTGRGVAPEIITFSNFWGRLEILGFKRYEKISSGPNAFSATDPHRLTRTRETKGLSGVVVNRYSLLVTRKRIV